MSAKAELWGTDVAGAPLSTRPLTFGEMSQDRQHKIIIRSYDAHHTIKKEKGDNNKR